MSGRATGNAARKQDSTMKNLVLALLFLGVAARPDPRRPWQQDRPAFPPYRPPPYEPGRDRPPIWPGSRDPWQQDNPGPGWDDWPTWEGEEFPGGMGEGWPTPGFDDFPMSSGWGMDDEQPTWPEQRPPCKPSKPGNRPTDGDTGAPGPDPGFEGPTTNPGQNERGDRVPRGSGPRQPSQQERPFPPAFRPPPQSPLSGSATDFGWGTENDRQPAWQGQGFDRPGFDRNRRPPRAGPGGRRPGGPRPERPQGGGRFERPNGRDPALRPPKGPFGPGGREPFEETPFGGRPLSPDEVAHREFIPIFTADNITIQNASGFPLKKGDNVFLLPKGGRRGFPGRPGQRPPQDLYGYGYRYGYGYGFQPYLKLSYNPTATPNVSFEYGITQLLPGFLKADPEGETENEEEVPGA
ncbi:hypothetical protein MATL_G00222390 [Megalops atlanticus]|uniref:Uncharacterized protein n=1 Tax=Megalops atlanticus TaxID=7932 RepID=A0A9D3PEL9_MEGAT|nr:hypothetical protein MATL_G00222390 [Megalops atlanticus]